MSTTFALALPVMAEGPGPGRVRDPEHDKQVLEMVEKRRAQEMRLDELVEAMNAAEGSAKIPAMEAVLNELVAERRLMRENRVKVREMSDRMRDKRERERRELEGGNN